MTETSARPEPEPAARTRRRWVPWTVAGVLAVLVTLIAVALPHVRDVSNHARDAAAAGKTVALPSDYQEAVQAAATEAANILTYSRKSFDADWDRSLAGSTGKLRKDQVAKRDTAKQTLEKNKIDLKAQVQQSAYEGLDDNGDIVALVTVNGYAENDQGERSSQTPQRLELTMVKSGDKWLASDLTMIGIQ